MNQLKHSVALLRILLICFLEWLNWKIASLTCQMSTTWFKGESRQESSGVDELLQEDRRSAQWSNRMGPTSRFSRANEVIERERDPFPTTEEVLHDVNGSTVFSRLNQKLASSRWNYSQIMSYYSLYYTPRFLPVQKINVRNYLSSWEISKIAKMCW